MEEQRRRAAKLTAAVGTRPTDLPDRAERINMYSTQQHNVASVIDVSIERRDWLAWNLRTVIGLAWGLPKSIDEWRASDWCDEDEGGMGRNAGWNRGKFLIFLMAKVSFFWCPTADKRRRRAKRISRVQNERSLFSSSPLEFQGMRCGCARVYNYRTLADRCSHRPIVRREVSFFLY